MKLKIKKEIFKKHLNNITKGIVSYSPLFALKGILMDVGESKLILLASDGFLSFKEEIEINQETTIEEPGKILVPGRIFKEVIDNMEDTIAIATSETKMTLKSGLTHTEINLFNSEDYPRIAFETFGKELIIDANKFRDMIKNVAFASAVEDKRQILNGVNIKASQGQLIVSATDSFRMARQITTIDSTIDFDITIMSKKIRDFLPSNATGSIKINVDDSKIISKIGSTTISSRIIDGVYPPIEKLIAADYQSTIKTTTNDLEKNIDRVTLVTEGSRSVIRLECDDANFSLESKKSEIGAATSKIENFEFEGEPISIAFDHSFLKDAISKFDGKIEIAFNGEHKPFIVKAKSNPELIQLIMPHRTF